MNLKYQRKMLEFNEKSRNIKPKNGGKEELKKLT